MAMRRRRLHKQIITGICCVAALLAGLCPWLSAKRVFAAEEPYPMFYEEKPAGEAMSST